jgi:thioredoxin-like negative regulator of GroEL
MAEIVASHNQKFGSMREISKSDYPLEVTKASKDVDVVVLLYQDSVEDSRLISVILARLAEIYRGVKFLKIKVNNLQIPIGNKPNGLANPDRDLICNSVLQIHTKQIPN